tara:strand:+ start:43 stop:432 length:390 start_codon:yes stop_codon:yes gene_type:complete
MSYIKLKKAGGAFDLIPADNIIYVKGTEGGAESGGGDNGAAPFVEIVQGTVDSAGKLLASKVIIGPATGVVATTGAATIMQNAVNAAIVASAQAEGLVVEVDFDAILNEANYTGTTSDVTSAAPFIHEI